MRKTVYLLAIACLLLTSCGELQIHIVNNTPSADVGAATKAPAVPAVPAVTTAPAVTASATVIPTAQLAPTAKPTTAANAPACASSWFFSFNSKHTELGAYCPAPVISVEAVGQDFEGGRAYRYAADPAYTADQRGTVYVIYNDGEWKTYPDGWDSSQPANDPSLSPPADRYQPVNSIGKVWREVPEVRKRLGWALENQAAFKGRYQLYSTQPGVQGGDSHFFFIDHGKWGLVLLLNAVDMGPNSWEVAGSY